MDDRDARILIAISELGTGSSERIAEETGIPKSTVHYRIQNLRDQGIIKNDRYEFDLEEVGLEILVISEIVAVYEEEYHNRVGEKIGEVEGVRQVFFTMGDVDFVAISRLTDRTMVEEMFAELEAMDGIERTMSKFVISTVKDDYNSLEGYEIDTLTDDDTQS